MATLPAVLVSMPFMHADRPSIQLGLLKAIAEEAGFPVRTLHANLDFAAMIGVEYYEVLAEHQARLVGDWLFSKEAFGDAAPDPNGRLLDEYGEELTALDPARLRQIRDHDIPAYLDAIVDGFAWDQARVVGFSSTFQQNTASFALARRLKQHFPELITIFGGANFDGEMGLELVRSVDCIDYAIIGEGDSAFPSLLSALANGTDPTGIPGVATCSSAIPPAPPNGRLDDLPLPDYAEFFERAATLGIEQAEPWIPFESARGCWWGAKHHCTFCGLNGTTMRFRSKSPKRVLDELAQQARRYRAFRFEAVDNILDMTYLKEIFPETVTSDYEIFYEIKANLSRDHVRVLARGGVSHVQPGIESLNSHVLSLMDKGVRAAQNVNLLRWARYYGIGVGWNILWGFPGETEEDYRAQAAAIPNLVHLQPPESANRLWLERFSPLYNQPERFRLRHRKPEPSYHYVYPSTVDVERIAYFFDYEFEDSLPASTYEPLRKAVGEWRHAWEGPPPVLAYRASPGLLKLADSRRQGRDGTYTFRDTLADIYLACSDRPTTATAVRDKLGVKLPVTAIEDAFAQFAERGLMFLDGNLALALALPANRGR